MTGVEAEGTPVGGRPVPMFEARGVSKAYGHVNALMDVDFEVRPNEVVGLLGDNGADTSLNELTDIIMTH